MNNSEINNIQSSSFFKGGNHPSSSSTGEGSNQFSKNKTSTVKKIQTLIQTTDQLGFAKGARVEKLYCDTSRSLSTSENRPSLLLYRHEKIPSKKPQTGIITYPGSNKPSPMHSMMQPGFEQVIQIGVQRYSGFQVAIMGDQLFEKLIRELKGEEQKDLTQLRQSFQDYYRGITSFSLQLQSGEKKKVVQITHPTSAYAPGHALVVGPGCAPTVDSATYRATQVKAVLAELKSNKFSSFDKLDEINDPNLLNILQAHYASMHDQVDGQENDTNPTAVAEIAKEANINAAITGNWVMAGQNGKPVGSIRDFWHLHLVRYDPNNPPAIDRADRSKPFFETPLCKCQVPLFPGTTITIIEQGLLDLDKLDIIAQRIENETTNVTVQFRTVPLGEEKFEHQFFLIKNPDHHLLVKNDNDEKPHLLAIPSNGPIPKGIRNGEEGFLPGWGWGERAGLFPTDKEQITQDEVDAIYDRIELYQVEPSTFEHCKAIVREELE